MNHKYKNLISTDPPKLPTLPKIYITNHNKRIRISENQELLTLLYRDVGETPTACKLRIVGIIYI